MQNLFSPLLDEFSAVQLLTFLHDDDGNQPGSQQRPCANIMICGQFHRGAARVREGVQHVTSSL